jgi:RNA polymerase sigma-70 factor (ECF subfamily)
VFAASSQVFAREPGESTSIADRRIVPRGGSVASSTASAQRLEHQEVSAPPAGGRDEALLRELVARVRADDLQAFERLYRLTRDDAARALRHLVGGRADVEDLLQEVYLQLLKAVRKFRGESRFRTFLYRVCANVAISHLRWRRRRPEDVMAEVPERPSAAPGPEDEAARRQAQRLVEAALEDLAPKKRVVFVYHELCGMLPEEIAQAVDAPVNTVRSRLHHARLEFNDAMQRLLLRDPKGGPHALLR